MCKYYEYTPAQWGSHGGAPPEQACTHPRSDGLECDTPECPVYERFCNVCGQQEVKHLRVDGFDMCGGCALLHFIDNKVG